MSGCQILDIKIIRSIFMVQDYASRDKSSHVLYLNTTINIYQTINMYLSTHGKVGKTYYVKSKQPRCLNTLHMTMGY